MTTNTYEKIREILGKVGKMTAFQLADELNISRQAMHRQLKNLQRDNIIDKIGTPPKVFYFIKEKPGIVNNLPIDAKLKKFIDQYYLIITPAGERKTGWEGFSYWCRKNKLDSAKTAVEYKNTLAKYFSFKKDGLIDGLGKIRNTFNKVNLDALYYLDFYSLERFGKTRLGQLLLYAKQSQDKNLMKELIKDIKPAIDKLIKNKNIDAVGFVPPTVKREIQFMKQLEKNLNLNLPRITITKIKTPVIIPQKTLNKLEDRMENAKRTFMVDSNITSQNILLIDDAVGSGATINEIAGQLRYKKDGIIKIIGLAITGSLKGFDVISEI